MALAAVGILIAEFLEHFPQILVKAASPSLLTFLSL